MHCAAVSAPTACDRAGRTEICGRAAEIGQLVAGASIGKDVFGLYIPADGHNFEQAGMSAKRTQERIRCSTAFLKRMVYINGSVGTDVQWAVANCGAVAGHHSKPGQTRFQAC